MDLASQSINRVLTPYNHVIKGNYGRTLIITIMENAKLMNTEKLTILFFNQAKLNCLLEIWDIDHNIRVLRWESAFSPSL